MVSIEGWLLRHSKETLGELKEVKSEVQRRVSTVSSLGGCISASVVGDMVKNYGIMNTDKHHQLLIHHAVPFGKLIFSKGFIFQQLKEWNKNKK